MRLPERFVAATPQELQSLAARVAEVLRAGDLVLLSGPLGAGKTTFAQGIGAALGVHERLTSPTFVIAREHRGRVPVVHVDAYRLGGLDELEDLDLESELEESVTLVEWGQGMAEALADHYLLVDIDREPLPDELAHDPTSRSSSQRSVSAAESRRGETRVVRLSGYGQRWAGVIEEAS